MVLLGQWSVGFISFFEPKRLGAFGGSVVGGLVSDFKVGDVKQVREGKFYITRVPEGFWLPICTTSRSPSHSATTARGSMAFTIRR